MLRRKELQVNLYRLPVNLRRLLTNPVKRGDRLMPRFKLAGSQTPDPLRQTGILCDGDFSARRFIRMAVGTLPLICLTCICLTIAGLAASPLYGQTSSEGRTTELEFVDGLRSRGYYDTALEHLDELGRKSDLSAELRDVLDLERGLTLQQMGSATRLPQDREQILGQSEEALRRFISQHPQHAQAAFANSSLGELLFARARTLIWQSESPSNEPKRAEMQSQARQLIDDAEAIYRKAHDLYLAQEKAFPGFIDKDKDPEQFQKREDNDAKFLGAWFNLARCMYERGQTFEKGSAERNETLIKASSLFEAIHTSRRTNPIGLHARLMMGKCFQEQDDLGRALGFYQEVLSHKSDHPNVQTVKNIAKHYRLICLNDPKKNDHPLVLQEATEWIAANRSLMSTSTGLGILWEKAIAEEKLSEDRNADAQSKEVLLRQAMADAQQVARFPGAYREPASAMSRRLKAALGEKDKEPRDFETAFERARGMIDQIQKLKDEAEAAATETDRQQKATALDLHLNEVGRLLQLALDLRNSDTEPKAVAQARYLLSFIYYRQRKNFDAVILSSYCMVKDRVADPDTALNATDIAITAAVQAWNDAARGDRDFETQLLRDVCVKVLELYPQSARGNEARIRLGRVYQQLQEPLEAATWFLQVPESDPQFATARISAGQAFWAAWSMQSAEDETADPQNRRSPEDLLKARNEAKNLLTQGIQLFRDRLGPDAAQPDEVIAAEVSLASILNMEGDFAQSIQRLTSGGENSVVNAIQVPEAESRPESGIMSQSFAGLTMRLLLRAYVGTQQIDEALQTMGQLEKVGGQDVTAVYTQLGMELQEELKRLKQAGDTQRLAEVRNSFEKFLGRVFEKRDPSDYNSLLWIGETYFGLGKGVSDDTAAAASYFEKAAETYNTVIQNNLATEPAATAIRLRLARCRRQQKMFEPAYQICTDILKKNPLALDAQFEAALILGDWGAEGQPQRLLDSIQGVKDEKGDQVIWGWANIARRLQQAVRKDTSAEMKERFLDSRLQLSSARRRYAATGAQDGAVQLRSALAEITIFTQIYRDIDAVWWSRFDRLFQDIQTDLKQTPKPLERPVMVAAVETPAKVAAVPGQNESGKSADSAAAATAAGGVPPTNVTPAAPSGPGWLVTTLIIGVAAGAAVGFYFLLSRPRTRRKVNFAPSPGSGTLGAGVPDFSVFGQVAELPPGSLAFSQKETGRSASSEAASARVASPGRKVAPPTIQGTAAKPVRRPPVEGTAESASGMASRKPVGATPPKAESGNADLAPKPRPKPAEGTKSPVSSPSPSTSSSNVNPAPPVRRPAAPKTSPPQTDTSGTETARSRGAAKPESGSGPSDTAPKPAARPTSAKPVSPQRPAGSAEADSGGKSVKGLPPAQGDKNQSPADRPQKSPPRETDQGGAG